MTPLMLLLVVFLLGYLATHLFITRLRKSQYLFIGIEYIIAGILINPGFTNKINSILGVKIPILLNTNIIYQIKPGVLLVLGFYGLIAGLKFKLKNLSVSDKSDWLLSFYEIFFSFVVLGVLTFIPLFYFFYNGVNLTYLLSGAYLLAIASSVNSHSFIKSISEKLNLVGPLSKLFFNSSFITFNFGILIYGFLYAIFRVENNVVFSFTQIEWVVLSLFFAAIMGLLFFLFLGNEKDENKIYVALIGIVLFSVGVAFLLKLSPIYITFIIGAILTNVSKISDEILKVFEKIYQPISVLIVIFAGIFWIPTPFTYFFAVAILFALLRFSSKMIAGYFTYSSIKGEKDIPVLSGYALQSTDILLCGMAIEYHFLYPSPIVPYVVTAVLSSVIIFNIYGFIKTKNFLIDFDDIKSKTL
ncbi:MAG TPA: hypothetical protein PL041_11535 [Melioribacteraceae bacterium]|nr:hypothetical protein [Melioribacteraceae bacterium]